MKPLPSIQLLLLMPALLLAEDFSSSHQWSFPNGNQVSNWSFEEYSQELCQEGFQDPGTSAEIFEHYCRFKPTGMAGEPAPHSGNYVMKVLTSNSSQFKRAQKASLQTEPGTAYVISYYVDAITAGQGSSNFPKIEYYDGLRQSLGSEMGPTYESVLAGHQCEWIKYIFAFTTPPRAESITLYLLGSQASSTNSGNVFYFDDILISRAGQAERSVLESRSYGDAVGAVDHSIINDGIVQVVNKNEYDGRKQLVRSYLPVPVAVNNDLQQIIVSGLDLHPDLTVDFLDIQSAYASLAASISMIPESAFPNGIKVNIIVANSGDLAPLTAESMSITSFTSSDGGEVFLELYGIVKGTAEYADLVQSEADRVRFSGSGPFFYPGTFSDLGKAEYKIDNVFSEFAYPNDGSNRTSKAALPGPGYEMNAAARHYMSSGDGLLASGDVPGNPEFNPGNDGAPIEAEYGYQWSRDRQGGYEISISNPEGRIAKKGIAKTTDPSLPADYALASYGYDDFGRMVSVSSPEGYSSTYLYNGIGELVKHSDPDKGIRFFLFDPKKRLRLSKTAEGDVKGRVNFIKYDFLGRPLGTGTVPKSQFTQTNADDDAYPANSNINIGSIYDEVDAATWLERTGTNFSDLGLNPTVLKNTSGKQICGYNKNAESVAPGFGDPKMRLVASFYSYDDKGRPQEIYKYVGSAPAAKKWSKIKYEYDDLDRVISQSVFNGMNENQLTTRSTTVFNNKGLIEKVMDKSGGELSKYSYNFRNEMIRSTIMDKLKVDRTYDAQGKQISLRSFQKSGSKKDIYSEYLGYESRPSDLMQNDLPSGAMKRFDGKLSSILQKFSSAESNNVKWEQFGYHPSEYLNASAVYLPSSSNHFNSDGSLNLMALDFGGAASETNAFVQDDDARITSFRNGGRTHSYTYPSSNHQLGSISPDITAGRRTSDAGNFEYDANGNLVKDHGSLVDYAYDAQDMPISVDKNGKGFHFLYDENQLRVATLVEGAGGTLTSRKSLVRSPGGAVEREIQESGSGIVTKNNLTAAEGVVGFDLEETGGRILLVKDHRGSVINNILVSSMNIEDEKGYNVYGGIQARIVPASNLHVSSEAYTGKEFVDEVGYYDFGARAYDPQILVWLMPDPLSEFWNPYSFVGGDPVNRSDPDGKVSVGAWNVPPGGEAGLINASVNTSSHPGPVSVRVGGHNAATGVAHGAAGNAASTASTSQSAAASNSGAAGNAGAGAGGKGGTSGSGAAAAGTSGTGRGAGGTGSGSGTGHGPRADPGINSGLGVSGWDDGMGGLLFSLAEEGVESGLVGTEGAQQAAYNAANQIISRTPASKPISGTPRMAAFIKMHGLADQASRSGKSLQAARLAGNSLGVLMLVVDAVGGGEAIADAQNQGNTRGALEAGGKTAGSIISVLALGNATVSAGVYVGVMVTVGSAGVLGPAAPVAGVAAGLAVGGAIGVGISKLGGYLGSSAAGAAYGALR